MNRKLRLAALVTVLLLVVLEALSAAFFVTFRDRFRFADPADYVLSPEEARSYADAFDPELGWLPRHATPYGERPRRVDRGRPWLAAFGDSYVQGDEVGHEETWLEALGDLAGGDALNLGVGGYAPDQALLRFRREAGRLPVRVVVLGFTPENVNRIVNRYRPFYFRDTGLPLPKPRFVLRSGRLELLRVPIARGEGLERLTRPRTVAALGRDDYWYLSGGKLRWGFPFLRLALSPATWRQAVESRARSEIRGAGANLWRGEARDLFLAILDAFVSDAKQAGVEPVLALLSGPSQVDAARSGTGIPGYNPILDHCAARGHAVFDAIAALAEGDEPAEDLFMPGGHYSPSGHLRVARGLHRFLGERDLLPRPES